MVSTKWRLYAVDLLAAFLLPSWALINVQRRRLAPCIFAGSRSRAGSTEVTYFARPALTVIFFVFVLLFFFPCVFVVCRFRLEITARCHLHALLVASRCLPEPLNAPLCWYADMAPSAVGHCQLLCRSRGKTTGTASATTLSHYCSCQTTHSCRETRTHILQTEPPGLLNGLNALCGCLPTRSRKASLKDKVFPSPSKAPITKGKAQSPGPDDGTEASPNKVAKSWSFTEKNRGPKPAFRARGSASRQNSDGKRSRKLPCPCQVT